MMERAENVVVKKTEAFADKTDHRIKRGQRNEVLVTTIISASYLSESEYKSILDDNVEIIKLLTSITKTVKSNL